jgi:PAS domain S-box-containing protein
MTDEFSSVMETLCRRLDFTLYRGREHVSQAPILALAAPGDRTEQLSVQKFEHELSLSDVLGGDWAAKPIRLARYKGQPVLVMDDPGGKPLDCLIRQSKGAPIDVPRLLRVAIGIARALGQAHSNRIVHKDLCPSNILYEEAGRAWLMGFGFASRLSRERLQPTPPEAIPGTFAYMSPEQTGRMNRSVDFRSDLYSLGVTLYELFSGVLPFSASDPMEWVHCHIARQPAPPTEKSADIPIQISSIIVKLLAKQAEDRYQTASGLKRDLQKCLDAWETYGYIEEFCLGENDTPDQLLVPEKLYGREAEVKKLLDCFERVVTFNRPELILVSGYSGVGKSAVVNEIHKVLVPLRGYFAFGKYDQYKRESPYAIIVQAFQSLIRPILSKSDVELERWRDTIVAALGPNVQLMVEMLPELKHIVGDRPPVPELPAQDAHNRMKIIFRRFVRVFTQDRPLALFLDDLQWLDAATLELLGDLLVDEGANRLMLIGAYRDNEVDSSHPLIRALDVIRQSGIKVTDIVLSPLHRRALRELTADFLYCDQETVTPLVELIDEKTNGNPFFTIQFITALAEDSLLTFDYDIGRWRWDLACIEKRGYTDNVIDLMTEKLRRLSSGAQSALQRFSCLGNTVDVNTLAMIYPEDHERTREQLGEAVQMGLISQSENTYRFIHDRVQEAAYAQIPSEDRANMHFRNGKMMATHVHPDDLEDAVFEIANQLNHGLHLITGDEEREFVAQINVIAGRRAVHSAAYLSALEYLHTARNLFSFTGRERNCDMFFSVESLLAECEMLTANFEIAEERLRCLADHVKQQPHEFSIVTRLRLTLYDLVGRSELGVAVFIEYQESLGEVWSAHPDDTQVYVEYQRIWSLLNDREVRELIDLPIITDSTILDVLSVMAEVVMQAMYTDQNLLALVLCRMVCISLEYGNSDAACFAYVSLGMIAGPHFQNYKAGYRFGALGYDLVEERGLRRYQARVYLRFASHIVPWNDHIKNGREILNRTFDIANRNGDLTYASYSFTNLCTNLLASGDHLKDVQRVATSGLDYAKRLNFQRAIAPLSTQLAFVRSLRGETKEFGFLNDGEFDESNFESHVATSPSLLIPACFYWIRKLQARYLAGDYESANRASKEAKPLIWSIRSFFETSEYHFYSALSRAASFRMGDDERQAADGAKLFEHQTQLKIWVENSPLTFQDRFLLVSAEIARIENRDMDAIRLYDEAIREARRNAFTHIEAIACELAGKFFLSRRVETAGYTYIEMARQSYDRWGATGKVFQIDQQFSPQPWRNAPRSLEAGNEAIARLDVGTVVKASQALSREIILPSLIETLMRLAMEHAGAERGVLVQIDARGQYIEAEAIAGSGTFETFARKDLVCSKSLPELVLFYVRRTQKSLLIEDACDDINYSTDEYISTNRTRSILCLPIIKQSRVIGILYLENNLASGVFTSQQVALLQLLASQAAISLANASLFSELQRSEAFMAQGQKIAQTGSFGWSARGGNYSWSGELYNIFEYREEVRASAAAAFRRIHPDDRTVVRELIARASTDKVGFDGEYRLMMPDGRIKYVHATGRPVNIADLDFVGAVRDVTERKSAEVTLRQAIADLSHITRVTTMGELTASLAHEIRQPIAAVIAHADAILRWLDSDQPNIEKVRKSTERIVRDGHRSARIIDGIRAQFKKERLNPEIFDINLVVEETLELLRAETLRFNIAVRLELAGELPKLIGDRIQLQQVLLNLVVNGIEAMKDIDYVRELFLRTEFVPLGKILVSVSDTGFGVPTELAEKIFDPFFTTKDHGFGMGLRVSRSIIEDHGGELWIEENHARGATFVFTLPATSISALESNRRIGHLSQNR